MDYYNIHLTLQMDISEEQLKPFRAIHSRKRLFDRDIRTLWYNLTHDANTRGWYTKTLVEMLNFQLKEHGYQFTAYTTETKWEWSVVTYWKISKPKHR